MTPAQATHTATQLRIAVDLAYALNAADTEARPFGGAAHLAADACCSAFDVAEELFSVLVEAGKIGDPTVRHDRHSTDNPLTWDQWMGSGCEEALFGECFNPHGRAGDPLIRARDLVSGDVILNDHGIPEIYVAAVYRSGADRTVDGYPYTHGGRERDSTTIATRRYHHNKQIKIRRRS